MKHVLSFFRRASSRLRRLFRKIRLRPIQVFCLHQVCDRIDSARCYESDFCPTDSFINRIIDIRKTARFVSLSEAHQKIQKDILRRQRYVVLTFDDGYKSTLPVYHWLDRQHIPYTLFLNGLYLDGNKCSKHILDRYVSFFGTAQEDEVAKGLYLSATDLQSLDPDLCQIASHGLEHIDATSLSSDQFTNQVVLNFEKLRSLRNPIAFHAYTWGRHNAETDCILKEMGITPVLMDGQKNYHEAFVIHREEFPIE